VGAGAESGNEVEGESRKTSTGGGAEPELNMSASWH
jgi:hypothetical protein